MYETLERMGLTGGNVLEPSCGIGNFMGMVPDSMQDIRMYGVELDGISAGIARQLYQKNPIAAQGFEETQFPDSFFDAGRLGGIHRDGAKQYKGSQNGEENDSENECGAENLCGTGEGSGVMLHNGFLSILRFGGDPKRLCIEGRSAKGGYVRSSGEDRCAYRCCRG
jgi:hypothetical protein